MGLGSLIGNDIGMITGFLQNRSAGQQQQKRDEDRNKIATQEMAQRETGQALDIMSTIASLGERDARNDAAIDAALTKQLELATAVSTQMQRAELATKGNSATKAYEQAQLEQLLSLQKANAAHLGSLAGQKETSRVLQDSLMSLAARNATIDGTMQMRDKMQQLMQPQLPAAAAPQAIQGDNFERPAYASPTEQVMQNEAANAKRTARAQSQPMAEQPAAMETPDIAGQGTWEQQAAAAGLATPEEAKTAATMAEKDQEDEEQYLNAETTRYREIKDSVRKAKADSTALRMKEFPELNDVTQLAILQSLKSAQDSGPIKAMIEAYKTAGPAEKTKLIADIRKELDTITTDYEMELADVEPEYKARKERSRKRFNVKANESFTDFAERYATEQKWDLTKPATPEQIDEMKKAYNKGSKQ